MKIAIYPGSFDPVTFGHLDVIARSAKMVDKLIIAVLLNKNKSALFSMEDRVRMISEYVKDVPSVEVHSFSGLTVDYAKKVGATMIVRGLRAVSDFEYELQLAQTNKVIAEEIDTLFLATNLKYSYLSSSIVKEIASYNGDISAFVPKMVETAMKEKYGF